MGADLHEAMKPLVENLEGGVFDDCGHYIPEEKPEALARWHCCKVSDEAAFCLIQRPYISKTLLTRRISPRGSP